MANRDWDVLNNLKVGIVGCGHLGQAIAQTLIEHGVEKHNLFISYRGNPLTYQHLQEQGLAGCLTSNERIFQEAGLVLVTLKPQDIFQLKEAALLGKALIVSCMAGIPTRLLCQILGADVYRMMFSGPHTILSGTGIAALYPEQAQLELLLRCIHVRYIKVMTEEDLEVFTAGVCLPAAIIKDGSPNGQQEAIDKIGAEYPLLSVLYTWASSALPVFQTDDDKKQYIDKMITKGGITEAIIVALSDGAPLDLALRRGIARTKEISEEIKQAVEGRMQEDSAFSLLDRSSDL